VADPAEEHNLAATETEVVAQLTQLMERYIREGRSTRGAVQTNDVADIKWNPETEVQ
jgi:hypothetical protein